MAYLLSQQLIASGEHVVDVPAVLASRLRVLSSGRSDKNDPNDARSAAIAALRQPDLVRVRPEDHTQMLRMLAKRHLELTSLRTQAVCRLHSVLTQCICYVQLLSGTFCGVGDSTTGWCSTGLSHRHIEPQDHERQPIDEIGVQGSV